MDTDEKLWKEIKKAVLYWTIPKPDKKELLPEASLISLHLRDGKKGSHDIHNLTNLIHVFDDFEKQSGIEVDLDEIYELSTLQDVFDLIQKKLK